MMIQYRPIGTIRTPFAEPADAPRQPFAARGAEGVVEILPELEDGLADLEGFSHVVLLYHLHRSHGYSLRVVPPSETRERGVFATRSPRRPNPIGLSVVQLVGMKGPRLTVRDVDMLDGTPLLDIKPFVGRSPVEATVRRGWLSDLGGAEGLDAEPEGDE